MANKLPKNHKSFFFFLSISEKKIRQVSKFRHNFLFFSSGSKTAVLSSSIHRNLEAVFFSLFFLANFCIAT